MDQAKLKYKLQPEGGKIVHNVLHAIECLGHCELKDVLEHLEDQGVTYSYTQLKSALFRLHTQGMICLGHGWKLTGKALEGSLRDPRRAADLTATAPAFYWERATKPTPKSTPKPVPAVERAPDSLPLVQIVDDTTKFYAGQFMCFYKSAKRSASSPPIQITSVKTTRLYYAVAGGRESYVYRKEVAFLCKTAEAANTIIALIGERERTREQEIARVEQKRKEEIARVHVDAESNFVNALHQRFEVSIDLLRSSRINERLRGGAAAAA